jgi:hypothetical protein
LVLVCFWSPKGGSGTSVVAAAAGILISRRGPARIADLTGDQPAVLGLAHDPQLGLRDWLRAGPQALTEALDRLAIACNSSLTLLPAGAGSLAGVAPESGAALAVALQATAETTVCDGGRLDDDASAALAEVAGANVVVVRGCYLALRRAVHHPMIDHATGVVLVDEHGRSLGARDVEDVLGLPVVATIEARAVVARAVDAGTITARMPDLLARPMRHAIERLGCLRTDQAA